MTLRFQRDQAKAMQRYFQQQKAATIADRSQCALSFRPAVAADALTCSHAVSACLAAMHVKFLAGKLGRL